MNVLHNSVLSSKYNEFHVIVFFLSIFFILFLFFLFKKLFYYSYFKQNLTLIPDLNIKTITNIAMIIAMNTALIFVFSWLSGGFLGIFFQVYPGTRMMIENTLIRIGGILFGPILGIFIGFTTDLLTVILTSSVLNYGYLLAAVLNGFFGGVIHLLINMNGVKKAKTCIFNLFLIIFSLVCFFFLLKANVGSQSAKLSLLSLNINLDRNYIFGIVVFFAAVILSQFLASEKCMELVKLPKYSKNKIVVFYNKANTFMQIIVVGFCAYVLIDMISLPIFDQKMSSLPYEQFLIMRLVMAIPFLMTTTTIIWSICKLHQKVKLVPNQLVYAKPIATKELEVKKLFVNS